MKNGTDTLAFIYDENNIRMYKYVNDDIYTYYYDGDKLMLMTAPDYSMYFFYDADGRPYACYYNNLLLYYVLNQQGDVVKFVDSTGESYGVYRYDAWGNIIYQSSHAWMAANPLRYRGYVYDSETGLYYCQSRYYDPKIGRFINADAYATTGQGLLGNNMFAYCGNNPVNYADPSGEIAITTLILIGSAIVGAVCAGYTAYVEYQAGCDTVQIIGDSICAGLSAFCIVYSGGMSLYQCYLNYCYLNAMTPVTDVSISRTSSPAPQTSPTYSEMHKSGRSRPDEPSNAVPNGSYTQYDDKGDIYSYAQYDKLGRQSLRIDFQGKPHDGALPHTHLYVYPERGGKVQYTFDLSWHLLRE